MIYWKKQKGFTLIEVLIAASLFVVVIAMTTMILFDIITTEKRATILNAVYDDSRVVMEQLATLIHENAIDYDEYYSVNVIQPRLADNIPGIAYGMYHGVYSSRFYDPGLTYDPDTGIGSVGTNPENLGVECSDVPVDPLAPISECTLLYKFSKDKNTGKNPYEGRGEDEDTSNAFCDTNIAEAAGGNCSLYQSSENSTNWPTNADELFLISPDGTRKTIIGKLLIKVNPDPEINDTAIGMLELDGLDSDQNGMMDLFTCAPDYICDSTNSDYLVSALEDIFPGILDDDGVLTTLGLKTATRNNKIAVFNPTSSNFVPITPFRSTVADLKFIITPVDDPYKAYAEPNMQSHPSVTILLTMQPSAAEKAKYPGQNPPPIVIQRTVTAGVHGKVESYPPTNDLEWVSKLIPSH